jgi:acyl-[acyl-carrier-protein]-phospholipid O-acyltransferase/long-chain-fatty-acid--[acyl-carrier-protein] ligase
MSESSPETQVLGRIFLRNCRHALWRTKISDSTGAELTGGKLLARTLALKRLLERHVLGDGERIVGVLLPPSVPAVVVNAALAISRRVAVNLNYTVSTEIMNQCLRMVGIKRILTSRRFMEKMTFGPLDAELIYLEDLPPKITRLDKLRAAAAAFAMPIGRLERSLRLTETQPDDLFSIIFTSGSTGQPKGVMLSNRNIASNTMAIGDVIRLSPSDTLCGILPFFHALGFAVTLWAVLTLDLQAAYHFSPLDAKVIGKLCRERKVTILLATPTFLRTYLRRCDPADLKSLEVAVAGAEKLPRDLAEAFEKRFGVRPVEGYGITELSPLVSVNIPPSRAKAGALVGLKEGTVGRPVPGVSAKIVDPDTGVDLPPGQAGMLLISGPNVMQGYYGQPEKTAEVIRDGWYVTGDIALIDADGFIEITGRLSRFSKIGGEMIPHVKIEEALQQILSPDEHVLCAAVTSVPDEKRGERLVVLHTRLDKTLEQICQALRDAGLPNLWIPSADSFVEIPEIPVLGTGKLDLQAIKRVALEHFAGPSRD